MKSEDGSKGRDEAAWEGQAGVVQFKNKFFKKPFYGDTNILTVAFVEIHIYIYQTKYQKTENTGGRVFTAFLSQAGCCASQVKFCCNIISHRKLNTKRYYYF